MDYHANTSQQQAIQSYHQWSTIVVMLIVMLFSAIQLSNASTYISSMQKIGNHLDDSRLTNVVKTANSFPEVREHIRFVKSHTLPAYYLNKVFDIENAGRRILSCIFVLVAFAYLLIILVHYRVVDFAGLIFFAFLLAVGGEITIYTSTGLSAFPLIILASVVFLHVLLALHEKPISKRSFVIVNLIFVASTLLIYRNIVGVYAAATVLSFGDLLKSELNKGYFLSRSFRFLMLVVLPTVVALYIITSDTPAEFMKPGRLRQLYFFPSDYPETILGGMKFFSSHSIKLFLSAVSPHSYLTGSANVLWLNSLLGFFFLIGLITSWNRVGSSIVLFLLAGLTGHVILNLGTMVPYGDLRYFLSFFIAIPIITAMGFSRATELLFFLGWLRRWQARRFFSGVLSLCVIVGLFHYALVTFERNERIKDLIDTGVSNATYARDMHSAGIVLDGWTVETIKADFDDDVAQDTYLLKTNRQTWLEGVAPESIDKFERWQQFLAGKDTVVLITSMPFTDHHFGALFQASKGRFEIAQSTRHLTYNFTSLRLRADIEE